MGGVVRGHLLLFVAKEIVEILAGVSESTVEDPTNLPFQFIDIAFFLWKAHPTELDCLSDLAVNLCRPKHVAPRQIPFRRSD